MKSIKITNKNRKFLIIAVVLGQILMFITGLYTDRIFFSSNLAKTEHAWNHVVITKKYIYLNGRRMCSSDIEVRNYFFAGWYESNCSVLYDANEDSKQRDKIIEKYNSGI